MTKEELCEYVGEYVSFDFAIPARTNPNIEICQHLEGILLYDPKVVHPFSIKTPSGDRVGFHSNLIDLIYNFNVIEGAKA